MSAITYSSIAEKASLNEISNVMMAASAGNLWDLLQPWSRIDE
ncbi:MAG: hypothetical protein ABSH33_15670 [Steroidobacteraceae bacterium]